MMSQITCYIHQLFLYVLFLLSLPVCLSTCLSVQVRLPASCSLSCSVLLQASLSQFSVTPAGGSVGVWTRRAWSSTVPDRPGRLRAVRTNTADTHTDGILFAPLTSDVFITFQSHS